ncbi:MAG TPA: G1 family glutamic endopeptidase [Streptosporangiaceae bacterium]|nr:G1 family glutamic endopeptidase [Streptosporangiaceae bacterium]
MAAAPVLLAAPALAGTTGNADARAGARVVTSCGAGVSAVNVRLPAGFNPLTATPAQLAANDLPLRPTGRAQLAAWRKFVTGGVQAARTTCVFAPVTPSSAPRSIVGDVRPNQDQSIVGDAHHTSSQSIVGDSAPAQSPQSIVGDAQPAQSPQSIVGDAQPAQSIVGDASPVLATLTPPATAPRPSPGGNRATAATRTVVYGTWRVTRPKHDPAAAWSSWAGIGLGRAGNPLVQAGSSTGGYFGPYLWWRVAPQRPNEQRISLDTAAGDTVYVRIQLLRGEATVTLRDESTGAGGTYLLQYRRLDG